jgi:hypothetical protein
LEGKWSKKFKNGYEHFFLVNLWISWFSWTFLNFLDNLSSKMMFLNPRSLFRAWNQSTPWERTWKFPDISYFKDLRQNRGAKMIPKTALITRLKTKETTYSLVFVKYHVISFRSHSLRVFPVFLEYSLRLILETWRAGKNLKTDSNLAHQTKQKSLIFFKIHNHVNYLLGIC